MSFNPADILLIQIFGRAVGEWSGLFMIIGWAGFPFFIWRALQDDEPLDDTDA